MKTLSLYYNISNIDTSSSSITADSVILKGRTSVNYILTGISEDVTNALYLSIDYGDITPLTRYVRSAVYDYTTESIFDEILYGKIGGSILSIYSHDYINATKYSGIDFKAKLVMNFENGKNIEIIQPICLYRGSFYDDLQSVVAINSQILPLSTNTTFVNLESQYNQTIYPTILNV